MSNVNRTEIRIDLAFNLPQKGDRCASGPSLTVEDDTGSEPARARKYAGNPPIISGGAWAQAY